MSETPSPTPPARLRAELRRGEEPLHDFIHNAPIGVHSIDADGTILWANRAELELLGYSEEEYIGKSVADFHLERDAAEDILARLHRGDPVDDYEVRLRAKDGSIRHVLISSTPFRGDGKFIHSRCFIRDITQRRRPEEQLARRERQLQVMTDALPSLVAYVDANQHYRMVSAGYERWFGHPKSEVIGRHLGEVLGQDAYAAIRPHVERALRGMTVTYEAEVPYRDGGTRFIEATYIPQVADDGIVDGFVALVGDISERKGFERFRAVAGARAEKLLKITAAIADAVTSEQVFEAVVDHVGAAVGASSAGLWLVDDEAGTAWLARAWGVADVGKVALATLPLDSPTSVPVVDCIRGHAAIWIRSRAELLERYPHLRATPTSERRTRAAFLPLLAHGRVLGALALTIDEEREPGDDERDLLVLVSQYASQAVERLRLFEAERRSRAEAHVAAMRLGVLSRASRAFVDADLNLESRLQTAVTELGSALQSAVVIALADSQGLLRMVAFHHPDPLAQGLLKSLATTSPLRAGEGLTADVFASGKSVLIAQIDPDQVAQHAPPAYRTFVERYPSYAVICVPLRVHGRVIGTMTATRTLEGQSYAAADLALTEELAERAAVAIESSRLYQETRDARTRAEQLYRFAQAVVSASDVETIYQAALDSIEAALGIVRAAILTFDDDGVLRFKAWHNLSDEYRAAVEGHSPWPRDIAVPKPVVVPDAAQDPAMTPYRSLFEREGIGALAFIPLVTRGRLLGKLMVYYDHPHAFTSQELATAKAIANHLASVITRFTVVAALEETIRHNEVFAGALAHDLRNPLAAIMNAAQLLLMRHEGDRASGDADTKPISRILASGQRMTTMIDQLLDFTRARSGGGIDIQLQDTNLADLCTQAIGELELAHPEWDIQHVTSGDLGGSWDAARLLQVLSNLIANAGQHGSRDAPIRVKLDGTHPDRVELTIANQGAIPENLLPQLFDPFRSTRHRRDRSRGLGLGLFIVREIVHAHRGSVHVSSSPDDGTTFTIVLPRGMTE